MCAARVVATDCCRRFACCCSPASSALSTPSQPHPHELISIHHAGTAAAIVHPCSAPTAEGQRFLLMDTYSQLWSLLRMYISSAQQQSGVWCPHRCRCVVSPLPLCMHLSIVQQPSGAAAPVAVRLRVIAALAALPL